MHIAPRINGQERPHVQLSDIDLGSYDFWGRDDEFRHGAFATLRQKAPISYFPSLARPGESPGGGHWALTTHDDVRSS
jgi:hypothetical protein